MKIVVICFLLAIVTGCATNQYDAQIAIAEANVEVARENAYATGIEAANKERILVRIDGELVCSPERKLSGNCGVTFYDNTTARVIPQRDKNWVDGVQVVGDTLVGGLKAATPLLLAKEVTNIVSAVGKSAGGNVTNTDSGNSHSEANKTAGNDLVDGASSYDASTSSTSSTVEDISGTKISTEGDVKLNSDNPTSTDSHDDSSTTDSNDNSSTTTTTTEPETTPIP